MKMIIWLCISFAFILSGFAYIFWRCDDKADMKSALGLAIVCMIAPYLYWVGLIK